MRIMGNEDGMGSVNKGALMEIGSALPADIVAPGREPLRSVPALDAKVLTSATQLPASSAPATPEKKKGGGLGRLVLPALAAIAVGAAAFFRHGLGTKG